MLSQIKMIMRMKEPKVKWKLLKMKNNAVGYLDENLCLTPNLAHLVPT